MFESKIRARGFALLLTSAALIATPALAQFQPGSRPSTPQTGAPSPPAGGQQAYEYYGPPVIHFSGEKNGPYPKFYDTRQPGVLQDFINTYGPQAPQDAVNSSIIECNNWANLDKLMKTYQNQADNYKAEGKKLQKQLPGHIAMQEIYTGIGGALDVGSGIASMSTSGSVVGGLYTGGRVVGTIKQWGSDNWSGKLDRHFLNGTDVQMAGVAVDLADRELYHGVMKNYCPVLAGWIAQYGPQVGFRPVGTSR